MGRQKTLGRRREEEGRVTGNDMMKDRNRAGERGQSGGR